MTQRSRTFLTVSVRFPVPGDMSQKDAMAEFKKIVTNNPSQMIMHEAVIQLTAKETLYLPSNINGHQPTTTKET